jgi:hypothetical protein
MQFIYCPIRIKQLPAAAAWWLYGSQICFADFM